jgi:soluble lytic murein transglycosylase
MFAQGYKLVAGLLYIACMGTLNRYKYHLLAALLLLAALFVGVRTQVTAVTEEAKDLPRIETQGQLEHALELYPRKLHAKVLVPETHADQRQFLLTLVRRSLPPQFRSRTFEIARSVIMEANHHKLDPFYLLAVIQTESQFNLKARGTHGEIGLMQVMPKTAKWLAPQVGLHPDRINLEDPIQNIRIGATYFAKLRKSFDGNGTRYTAAYNMGPRNVRKLVAKKKEPAVYPTKVLGNYKQFRTALLNVQKYLEKDIATQAKRDVAGSKSSGPTRVMFWD